MVLKIEAGGEVVHEMTQYLERLPVVPEMLVLRCPECRVGYLARTGQQKKQGKSILYAHKCDKCQHMMGIRDVYFPHIEHRRVDDGAKAKGEEGDTPQETPVDDSPDAAATGP